jgi:hypothetical protein
MITEKIVKNGNLTLTEEHYRLISSKARTMRHRGRNPDREREGVLRLRRGADSAEKIRHAKDVEKFIDYHMKADENLVLEEIISWYLAHSRNSYFPERPSKSWHSD